MKEREFSICIWIHHIATFVGIGEGIYYLASGRQNFFKRLAILLLTGFQAWAGCKILADLKRGRSRLMKSCEDVGKFACSKREGQRILLGMAAVSALFKVLPVYILGRRR